MLRSVSKQSGNPCSQSGRRKRSYVTVGRICIKEGFKLGMKE